MPESQTIPNTQNPDLATINVLINDIELPQTTTVHSILVKLETNKIPYAHLTIEDGDNSTGEFKLGDEETFIPGNKIEIKAGYHSENESIFKGIIYKITNAFHNKKSTLEIVCKAEWEKMAWTKKSRHFEDQTDSDIAKLIFNEYGLTATIDDTNPQNKNVIQFNISDWDFVLNRLKRLGLMAFYNNNQLEFKKPDFNAATVLDLNFGATLEEFELELDARFQQGETNTISWNSKNQELQTATASNAQWTEAGNISNSDLANKISIQSQNNFLSGDVSEDALQMISDTENMYRQLAKIKGWGSIQGYAKVYPGNMVKLSGVGKRMEGNIFVKCVTHSIEKGDFKTKLCFGLCIDDEYKHTESKNGLISNIHGLQNAIVTDIEDPENEFRVKVKIPIVNFDEQGVWARIAMLDAGNERGFYFRPEIGDEVIVGFIQNDPNQPIIVGMLHSSALPAHITPAKDNDEKGYQSREKIKVTINDKNKSYTIETPAGKKITLDENEKIIQLKDENQNEITMDDNGIKISSQKDITISANANLKASGNAGAELSASGNTVVKGAMVQIN